MSSVNRRAVLAGGAATTVAAAVGLGLHSISDESLVRRSLERLLGRFTMNDADLRAFVRDHASVNFPPQDKTGIGLRFTEYLGLTTSAMEVVPVRIKSRIERFERNLVTAFMLTTSFPAVDSMKEPVEYLGRHVLCNPFARFD